ncbi:winged helix-turn-helix domain-containing protein [Niveibacterium sp. 24ML]|uniref:winged helix-turn-helix domain-containing protein n=1 Tax=Niveibacterium sp. 24ML TaxID=2985512 RepID=UPI00226D4FFC|nr:winged helix-turn-helix domain-containing protein [Niveibacterium sp. 24ML]MCX9155990.1 winged helix-turn-helix domain-containing protein [Niveibacterium sp. 24ML]
MRVLLVEDDKPLGAAVRDGLADLDVRCEWVCDGEAADAALSTDAASLDAVVLDLGLPKRSGLAVLSAARARGLRLPVLILTARDSAEDIVAGLDAGADDYLVKPADLREIAARLRALVRRAAGHAQARLSWRDVALEPSSRSTWKAGAAVDLSSREFEIAELLLRNAGQVVTRERIEQSLYGWEGGAESNALEVHIHHLRRKLGAEFIRTLRGIGYMVERTND